MDLSGAWQVIGLTPTTDRRKVRDAYRALVTITHPDHNAAPSAHSRTAQITLAYQLISTHLSTAPVQRTTPRPRTPSAPPVTARPTAVDTISVDGPPDLVASIVIDACHRFGELLIVDASAGLVQVAVEFVDGPTCHVLLDLQGRAHDGTTDVFVTVDSLEMRPAPDLAAVTVMIAGYLQDPTASS